MKNSKPVCFLVDDDPDDQEIFTLGLNQLDQEFECVLANNGLDALKKLKHASRLPDYIFLDINMPLMNGKEFLKEIKKHAAWKNIPVVIYSTSSSLNDIEETRALGAIDFIVKPFSLPELTALLTNFFRNHRQVQLSNL